MVHAQPLEEDGVADDDAGKYLTDDWGDLHPFAQHAGDLGQQEQYEQL
jgi:hypothetical protein